MYDTLLQSDTVHPNGLSKSDTSCVRYSVSVRYSKVIWDNPKDLITSESEDRGYG